MPKILQFNNNVIDDANPLVTRILNRLQLTKGNDSDETSNNSVIHQKSNDINDEHLKFPVKNAIIAKNYNGNISYLDILKQLKERLTFRTLSSFKQHKQIETLNKFPLKTVPNSRMGNIFPSEEKSERNDLIKAQKSQKAHSLQNELQKKFPVNEYKNKDKFPLYENLRQSRGDTKEFHYILNPPFTHPIVHEPLQENLLEFTTLKHFPCKQNILPGIDKYPTKDYLLVASPTVKAKRNVKRSSRKHLKPTHSLPANKWKIQKNVSSSVATPQMTHNYNELMAQVQNAQDHVENYQTLASSASNHFCGRVIEDNVSMLMVPAGASKNTNQKPEVQQNFENIERIGDDVCSYANRERKTSLSAQNMNQMNNELLVNRKEEQRTTPPLSVTSVCYGKSNTKLLDDLDGVYNDPVVLISSDVRDTCTLAVENGTNRNCQHNTGSALYTAYETPTFTSSEYGASINVASQVHHIKSNEFLICSDDILNSKVNEKEKHEIVFENPLDEKIGTNEVFVKLSNNKKENINKIAKNGSLFDEMKYEMKGVKGALPNNAQVSIGKPTETIATSTGLRSISSNTLRSSVGGNLSTDLSRFPNSARNELLNNDILENRSISLDNTLDSVLPERTRLRRQRRLKTDDESEDPIERLNRLKARISGALSEVKGVLKQYSNDSENEQTDLQVPKPSVLDTSPESRNEGPVHFRFVKKVRRCSLFLDEETSSSKEEIKNVNIQDAHKENLAKDEEEESRYERENASNETKIKTLPIQTPKDNKSDSTSAYTNESLKFPTSVDQSKFISGAFEADKELSKIQDSSRVHKELNDVPKMLAERLDNTSCLKEAGETQISESADRQTKHEFSEAKIERNSESTSKIKLTSEDLVTDPTAIETENLNLTLKQIHTNEIVSPPYQVSLEELSKTFVQSGASTNAIPEVGEINYSNNETNQKPIVKPPSTEDLLKVQISTESSSKVKNVNKSDEVEELKNFNNGTPISKIPDKVTDKVTKQKTIERVGVNHQPKLASEEQETSHSLYTLKEEDRESTKDSTEETCKTLKTEESIDTKRKLKKKLVSKQKDGGRRASIAAVESSKIEPPISTALPGKIKRRPSDSETVIKRKIIPSKATISGTVEDVNSKSKPIKVKRINATLNKSNEKCEQPVTHQVITTRDANKQDGISAKKINDETHSLPNDNTTIKRSLNEVITNEVKTLPTQLEVEQRTASLSPLSAKENLEATNATATATTTTLKAANDWPVMFATVPEITRAMTNSIQTREPINTVTPEFHDLLISESTVIITRNKAEDIAGKLQTGKPTDDIRENSQISAGKPQKITNELTQQSKQSEQVVVVAINKNVNNDATTSANVTQHQLPETNVAVIEKKITSRAEEIHEQQQQQQQVIATTTDITKPIECPQISNSRQEIIQEDTTSQEGAETTATVRDLTKDSEMPEQQLAPTPVQAAEIQAESTKHKKKFIHKEIIHQVKSTDKINDKTKEGNLNKNDEINISAEFPANETSDLKNECSGEEDQTQQTSKNIEELQSETEDISEKSKKERKVKRKVIIKRQQRRLSVTDSFFQRPNEEQNASAETETLEKPIAFVTDDEDDDHDDKIEEPQIVEEPKPLKSCLKVKSYEIGDEVLYADRYKKTQIKWRRGKVKERITSISYLIDIDGKDVSSHVNYLKKYTNRKVKFGGKEYLEIDYEQLAEEEERAEKLRKRTFSIWNMV